MMELLSHMKELHRPQKQFDVRREICEGLFGVKSGQRVRVEGHDGTAIGAAPDDGMLKMWYHQDGRFGARLYPVGCNVSLLDEVVKLDPLAGVGKPTATPAAAPPAPTPPAAPAVHADPERSDDERTLVIKYLDHPPEPLVLTKPFLRGKQRVEGLFDVRSDKCLQWFGAAPGQWFVRGGKVTEVAGMAADGGGSGPLKLFFKEHGSDIVGAYAPGAVLTKLDRRVDWTSDCKGLPTAVPPPSAQFPRAALSASSPTRAVAGIDTSAAILSVDAVPVRTPSVAGPLVSPPSQPSVAATTAGIDEWMERSSGYCVRPNATLMLTSLPSRDNPNARSRNLAHYVDSVDVLVSEVNRSVGEGSVVGAAFMGGNFAFAYVVMKDEATAQRIARQGVVHLLGRWRCKAALKQTVSTTSSLLGGSITSERKIKMQLPWDGRVPTFNSVFEGECHATHDCVTGTVTLQFPLRDHISRSGTVREFVELNKIIGGALLHYGAFPKLNLVLGRQLDFDAALSMYPPRTKLYLAAMWVLLHASGLGEVQLYGGCIRDGLVKGYLTEKGDIDVSYTATHLPIEAVIAAVNRVCETYRLPISFARNARQKENCHCAVASLTTGDAATVDVEFTLPGDFYASVMDLSFNNFELSTAKGLTQKYPGQGGLLMHAIHDSIHKVGFIVNPEDSDYQQRRRCKRLADGYHLVNGDRHGGRLEGHAGIEPLTFERAHALRLDKDPPGNPPHGSTSGGGRVDATQSPARTQSSNAPAATVRLFGRSLQVQEEQSC